MPHLCNHKQDEPKTIQTHCKSLVTHLHLFSAISLVNAAVKYIYTFFTSQNSRLRISAKLIVNLSLFNRHNNNNDGINCTHEYELWLWNETLLTGWNIETFSVSNIYFTFNLKWFMLLPNISHIFTARNQRNAMKNKLSQRRIGKRKQIIRFVCPESANITRNSQELWDS